jgi:hypothetical protein
MAGTASSAAIAGSEATEASSVAARREIRDFFMKNLRETGNRGLGTGNRK